MTSASPALVTRATVAPRRSSRALVATVVPWVSRSGTCLADELIESGSQRQAGVVRRGRHLGHRAVLGHQIGERATRCRCRPASRLDASQLGRIEHPDVVAQVVLQRPHAACPAPGRPGPTPARPRPRGGPARRRVGPGRRRPAGGWWAVASAAARSGRPGPPAPRSVPGPAAGHTDWGSG